MSFSINIRLQSAFVLLVLSDANFMVSARVGEVLQRARGGIMENGHIDSRLIHIIDCIKGYTHFRR